MIDSEFEGAIAIVTGGSAGIGLATAQALSARGAIVAVLDRDRPENEAGIRHFRVDVVNDDEVRDAVAEIGGLHGRIDILVNNAGVSHVGTVEDGTMDEWHRLFDINVLGYVRAARAALPHLRRSGQGSIVNVASCAAASGLRNRALYSTTKGAVEALTRAMAADLVAEGIRVNAVNPGTVDTPFMEKLAQQAPDPAVRRQQFHDRQPTGFMVAPDEVARAILYLASPAARSTTGSVLTVDGGISPLRIFEA